MKRLLGILGPVLLVFSAVQSPAGTGAQALDAVIIFVVEDTAGNPVGGTCFFGVPIAFAYVVCDNEDGSNLRAQCRRRC